MYELPHLLKRVHFAFRQVLDTALADYDLTWAQLDVLQRVSDCECAEHRILLQDMDIASPTLTKLVNNLVSNGYLERQISPDDARVKVLVPTEHGLAMKEKITTLYQETVNQFLDGVSPPERLLLIELVQRLIQNVDSMALSDS